MMLDKVGRLAGDLMGRLRLGDETDADVLYHRLESVAGAAEDEQADRQGGRRGRGGGSVSGLGWHLLPSFVSARCGHAVVADADPVDATSYLNGLRGLAAMCVLLQHVTTDFYPHVHRAYLATPEDRWAAQLPFVRLLISGRFMVAIFFLLSGFVLAFGPLRRAHAGDVAGALAGLPASVFRRPMRLFLPVLPVMVVTAVLVQLQVCYLDGPALELVPAAETTLAQLRVGWELWATVAWRPFVFDEFMPLPLFPQCWTLPLEFRGSVIVFLLCLTLARVRLWVRLGLVAWFAWWSVHHEQWAMSLFMIGMLLADVRHLRQRLPEPSALARWAIRSVATLTLLLALFIGGWPHRVQDAGLGYHQLAALGMHEGAGSLQNYWLTVAATLLMASLESLPLLQRLLNSSLMQYLGQISFGLYLTHWAVAYTVGKGSIKSMTEHGLDAFSAWLIGSICAILLSIWAGDLHWRLVDQNCVHLSRWVSKKVGV